MRKHERQLLGELFERAARRAGHPGLWCAYVSGRLGLGELDQRLQTLARAPAPRDRAASDALAARQDVDRAALWWVVVEGEHARATGARRHSGVRPASRARSARPGLKADR